VELLHVYRQALESPIIALAHRIREGKSFNWEPNERGNYIKDAGEHGKVEVRPWKKRMNDVAGVKTLGQVMLGYMDLKQYDPENDIILCPFNVKFGTIVLNQIIADRLTKDRDVDTWEVIARGKESYWAVGDKVLFEQMEAHIIDIRPTPGYAGKLPREASKNLRRDGTYSDGKTHAVEQRSTLDLMDELETSTLGTEQAKNSASHTIKIQFVDSGHTMDISASGEINKLLLAYAITVHKSQGSEWRRVFIALHYTHNVAISRELMYTAITRARHELTIFMDPGKDGSMDSLTKAARSPEIKGVTLAEKAEYFKGKAKEYQQMFAES
jgi:ATP-dependent exoDNAse (exonuclease V) alpha subunit